MAVCHAIIIKIHRVSNIWLVFKSLNFLRKFIFGFELVRGALLTLVTLLKVFWVFTRVVFCHRFSNWLFDRIFYRLFNGILCWIFYYIFGTTSLNFLWSIISLLWCIRFFYFNAFVNALAQTIIILVSTKLVSAANSIRRFKMRMDWRKTLWARKVNFLLLSLIFNCWTSTLWYVIFTFPSLRNCIIFTLIVEAFLHCSTCSRYPSINFCLYVDI